LHARSAENDQKWCYACGAHYYLRSADRVILLAVWQHWADWSLENFEKEFGEPGGADAKLLEADTNNNLALIALAARKDG